MQCGLRVADHAVITRAADIECEATRRLLPGILKASRLGYDGKGQARVNNVEQLRAAFAAMGGVACVLEKLMPIEREISVVTVRSDRETVCYPATENVHRDGILDTSILPARLAPQTARRARDIAMEVAQRLDYKGVLCVEFFVLKSGELVINEIAPRPHNSGHVTIDASMTSQFEQQVRVMCGMPLGDPGMRCPAVMINLLGDAWRDGVPDWQSIVADSRVKLHLYGKHEPRAGRKMGHITCLDDSLAAALARAFRIRELIAPGLVAVA
jgi:5-(carboxyamino)imidazole ribonucleotide synthase